MEILEIYKKYSIPKNLQEHQLKVASVALFIINNCQEDFDKELVITSCLLHDMGNIIKSDFDVFPEFLEPEGRNYWEEVKKSFIKKYGNHEDKATQQIARELGVSNLVQKMLENFKFKDSPKNNLEKNVNLCIYSDARVGPHGVISLRERVIDARKRYLKRNIKGVNEEYFDKMHKVWPEREQKILESCKIRPEEITENSIKTYFIELQNYKIRGIV